MMTNESGKMKTKFLIFLYSVRYLIIINDIIFNKLFLKNGNLHLINE